MATKIVIGTKSTAISIKTKNNTITINNIMASFGKILTPGYGDYLILKNVAYNLSKKNYIVNNKNITEDDLLVPRVMEDYLKYPSLYGDDIIKYFFNPDYVSEWTYIGNAIENELRIKDEKCYNFIKAVSDFEKD